MILIVINIQRILANVFHHILLPHQTFQFLNYVFTYFIRFSIFLQMFISGGGESDLYAVMARTGEKGIIFCYLFHTYLLWRHIFFLLNSMNFYLQILFL